MKLSELVEFTGRWLGIPAISVGSYARFLREARAISGGVKGAGAAEMTRDDKIALFVAVCACGTARTCAKQLPGWLSLPVATASPAENPPFDFLKQTTLKDALLELFGEINSGKVGAWCSGHALYGSGRFNVDRDGATITIERTQSAANAKFRSTESHSITFGSDVAVASTLLPASHPLSGMGHSKLIRDVELQGLAGWGACLRDE